MATTKDMAQQVLDKIGGSSNINQVWNCATRLRFKLKDEDKVDIEKVKNIDGVMGAQFSGNQFQVIIGNRVSDVYEEIDNMVDNQGDGNSEDKQGIVSSIMDFISGVFTPILPALAGAGLLKGLLAVFVTAGWMSPKSDTYFVLNAIGDSIFYFLPFFLAVSTAKKIRINEYLALVVAGTFMYPTFIESFSKMSEGGPKSLDFLGLGFFNIPFASYATTVIPIIISVIFLKYVYNAVKKVMPSALQLMFAPMIAFLIVIPLSLWLIGPLGNGLGALLAGAFTWLFDFSGLFAGLLIAGLMPLIVMTGMHYALAPIAITSLTTIGFDNMVGPAFLISNAAQAGAALGVAIVTRNKDMRYLGIPSSLSAAIGITEPAMYGVNMKMKKPFVLAIISASLIGAFAGWYGLKAFTMTGLMGVFAIPIFANPSGNMESLIVAAVLYVLSILLACILVVIFRFKEEKPNELITEEVNDNHIANNNEESAIDSKATTVLSPLKGKLVPLSKVSDATFSEEIMGKGIAIEPEENKVVSPIDGQIMVLPDSKHAIGIKGDNGEEILIHIGIDTVSLNGAFFKDHVKVGDHVKAGDLLVEFDREAIRSKDIQTVTMIIITNTMEYLDVLPINENGEIFEGEHLLSLVK